MKEKIYVAGPYSRPDCVANTNRAILVGDELRAKGFCPFIPHLTMLWHAVIPHPYEFWMEWDREWLLTCDAVLRIPGESPGADDETRIAKVYGIPVFDSIESLTKHYCEGK